MKRLLSFLIVGIGGVALGISLTTSLPSSAQQVQRFSDVTGSEYFAPAVDELSSQGVIRGYDNGNFGPLDTLTRGQVAVMFQRYDRARVEPLRQQIRELRDELGLSSTCEGGYQEGESFIGPDGCNTCVCGEGGNIACTKKACPDRRTCFSSTQCGEGEYCTTDDGECLNPCPEGANCIAACMGYCKERDDGIPVSCEGEKAAFDRVVQLNAACRQHSDCTLFSASCPFVTCAEAINVNGSADARRAAEAYTQCLEENNQPIACAACLRVEVACVSGQCITREAR